MTHTAVVIHCKPTACCFNHTCDLRLMTHDDFHAWFKIPLLVFTLTAVSAHHNHICISGSAYTFSGRCCHYLQVCSGAQCGEGCTGFRCANLCSGDGCGTNCTGDYCGQQCDGDNCAALCDGFICAYLCSGDSCGAGCTGDRYPPPPLPPPPPPPPPLPPAHSHPLPN
jgi:hypothetical protein